MWERVPKLISGFWDVPKFGRRGGGGGGGVLPHLCSTDVAVWESGRTLAATPGTPAAWSAHHLGTKKGQIKDKVKTKSFVIFVPDILRFFTLC